jgi:hypothetical protein
MARNDMARSETIAGDCHAVKSKNMARNDRRGYICLKKSIVFIL